jgi:regulator of protease activity HflC (stomatin/prohibitin superfamily)
MGAEEYFSGGRTQFTSEFQNQMENGVYLVERREVIETASRTQRSTANASLDSQQDFGDDKQVVFKVEKLLDTAGQPIRKTQNFAKFGISVVSARVTAVQPNQRFRERMQQKQDAATARGIAREQRIQEEEQRLLAIAKGEREVAERQAKARVIQIERTTNAETEKQLAITEANKLKEQAEIERNTAQILLDKAKVDADSLRVAAEAEAFARKARLESDNALQQKLDTELAIQRMWAQAFAQRNVPLYVFGGASGGQGGAPTGADNEGLLLQQLLTMEYAKRLDYDRTVAPE